MRISKQRATLDYDWSCDLVNNAGLPMVDMDSDPPGRFQSDTYPVFEAVLEYTTENDSDPEDGTGDITSEEYRVTITQDDWEQWVRDCAVGGHFPVCTRPDAERIIEDHLCPDDFDLE